MHEYDIAMAYETWPTTEHLATSRSPLIMAPV